MISRYVAGIVGALGVAGTAVAFSLAAPAGAQSGSAAVATTTPATTLVTSSVSRHYDCVDSGGTTIPSRVLTAVIKLPGSAQVGETINVEWDWDIEDADKALHAPVEVASGKAHRSGFLEVTGTETRSQGVIGATNSVVIAAGKPLKLPPMTNGFALSTPGTYKIQPGQFTTHIALAPERTITCTPKGTAPDPIALEIKPKPPVTHTVTVNPATTSNQVTVTPKGGAKTGGGGVDDGALPALLAVAALALAGVLGGLAIRAGRRSATQGHG